MRLTQWTDDSLRVTRDCAAHRERAAPIAIGEIAEAHAISRSRLDVVGRPGHGAPARVALAGPVRAGRGAAG
jgi:hypothetical protein